MGGKNITEVSWFFSWKEMKEKDTRRNQNERWKENASCKDLEKIKQRPNRFFYDFCMEKKERQPHQTSYPLSMLTNREYAGWRDAVATRTLSRSAVAVDSDRFVRWNPAASWSAHRRHLPVRHSIKHFLEIVFFNYDFDCILSWRLNVLAGCLVLI